MAKTAGRGHAIDTNDHGSSPVSLIVRIWVTGVLEHQIEVIQGVDVAGMGTEEHPRSYLKGVISDICPLNAELEQRLFGGQDVLLEGGEGGGIIQHDLIERGDELEGHRSSALDRCDDLIALPECVDELRQL